MKTDDLYKSVTASIIQHLKEGVPPWVKCWKGGTVTVPHNAVTGREYSGINTLILALQAMDKGYDSQGWLTFQQANALKAHVRKGEKATPVTFVKFIEKEEDGKTVKKPVLKAYYVFNRAQIDGLPADKVHVLTPPDDSHAAATELVSAYGVKVEYGGHEAKYSPNRDIIYMPPYGSFVDDAGFFGTLFHEVTHSTGHKDRLNRQYGKRFGDKTYSFEELVAELGSAFLCARTGYEASFRSAQYLDNWLQVLENDQRAIFSAASYAQQAADLVAESIHAVHDDTPEIEAQGIAAE